MQVSQLMPFCAHISRIMPSVTRSLSITNTELSDIDKPFDVIGVSVSLAFYCHSQRQADGELAALALFAFHRYTPVHQFHKLFHDGKTKPETVLRGGIAQPLERLEYQFFLPSRDAVNPYPPPSA